MAISQTDVSISSINTLFTIPTKPDIKFSQLYNFASGVPTSGSISLGSFKGKAPSTPNTTNFASQEGRSALSALSFVLNLATVSSDAYGTPLIYEKVTDATGTTSTLSGSTVSISVPQSSSIASTSQYRVKNRFNKFSLVDIPISVRSNILATLIISSNTTSYNIKNAAIAAGWNQVTPVDIILTINTNVVVGSDNVTAGYDDFGSVIYDYAINTGIGYPSGSTIQIINNGTITGKGGPGANGTDFVSEPARLAGGSALRIAYNTSIDNKGIIQGGGGGGGFGTRVNGPAYVENGRTYNNYYFGGAGGSGAGYSTNNGGSGGFIGKYDNFTKRYTFASEVLYGDSGSVTSGGAAGLRSHTQSGTTDGGKGGDPGASGKSTGAGPPGYYMSYESTVNVTWISTGTRYGSSIARFN